jgi:hypothetical protein
LGFAAALRVQNLKRQPVLLENTSALASLGDGRIPVAALTGGDLERVLCLNHRRRRAERQQGYGTAEDPKLTHRLLLTSLSCAARARSR